MIAPVESAIILAVPEVEPLVGALRLEGDVSAQHGVPAHVTLLYPFVEDPDIGVVEELCFFFAGVEGFALDFVAVGEFPEVVYLAPDQTKSSAKPSTPAKKKHSSSTTPMSGSSTNG